MAPLGQHPPHAADARAYEPRPASDRLLRGLGAWLDGPVTTAVVAGAPGAGTTFLLRSFEQRARGRRNVLFSPFLHIEPEALEPWLAGLALASEHLSLEDWLASAPDAPSLLLVDEAQTATLATLEALARLRETRAPDLRICLGGCAGPALEHAVRSVGGTDAVVFELPPWSAEDLRGFAAVLCALPAPEGDPRGRLPAVDPAALVAAAEGSPRLLREAWSMLREARTPAIPASIRAPDAAPRSPLATARAPAAPSLRRRRVPWFQIGALGVGFSLGLVGGWQDWDMTPEPAPEGPAPAAMVAAPPAVAAAPPPVAAPALHDVQVNARPWAWIRIDGRSVGVTPLVHRDLAGGEHEFEATFPDGRQERRTVEIGPGSRFVSFPE